MLPELIMKEEELLNYKALAMLGAGSGLIGIGIANRFFPGNGSLVAPMIAAVPLVFPLMNYYFREEEDPEFLTETMIYGSIFTGLVGAFFIGGLIVPDFFTAQIQTTGITGQATAENPTFVGVLSHNLTLFISILGISAFLGSSGAFILSLNASMVGVFFADLANSLSSFGGLFSTGSPIAYLPHTSLEMAGFIAAGILGTTSSASIYRQHLSLEHWKQLSKLLGVGVTSIVLAAFIETI